LLHKIWSKYELLSVRSLKSGSFGFAKGWFVFRAKPNVPLAGWLKLFLKNAGRQKK
jgi:hypothetical protein